MGKIRYNNRVRRKFRFTATDCFASEAVLVTIEDFINRVSIYPESEIHVRGFYAIFDRGCFLFCHNKKTGKIQYDYVVLDTISLLNHPQLTERIKFYDPKKEYIVAMMSNDYRCFALKVVSI